MPAKENEHRMDIKSILYSIFLFLNIVTKKIVNAAIEERKNKIWKALSVRTLINNPLELQRKAVKEIRIKPFLCCGIFEKIFFIIY